MPIYKEVNLSITLDDALREDVLTWLMSHMEELNSLEDIKNLVPKDSFLSSVKTLFHSSCTPVNGLPIINFKSIEDGGFILLLRIELTINACEEFRKFIKNILAKHIKEKNRMIGYFTEEINNEQELILIDDKNNVLFKQAQQ